jgi:hypothetical protein
VRCQGARRRSKRAVSDCFYNSRVRVKWSESDKAVAAGKTKNKTFGDGGTYNCVGFREQARQYIIAVSG